MPTYDFKCSSCSKVVEIKKSFSDENIEFCEECGSEMTRQLAIPAVQFKGKGFYSTDNRK